MSQIETLMVFLLGVALSLVVVMLFGRFFWGLAVAAAAKRKARFAPVEVLDAQAERDKLRAEHALMARKLDLRLEDIKVRMAEQMAEVSRNRNRVQGLIEENERKDQSLVQKEREIANLSAQLEVQRGELSASHKTIDGLNADARRSDAELARLQNAFRKVSVNMRDKQQALNDLSLDLRSAVVPAPIIDMHTHTENVLRQRVAEITAVSKEMRHEASTPIAEPSVEPQVAPHTHALSAKMEEAQRLSDDMERELKSLDDMLGYGKDQAMPQERPKRQARMGGNVISLAQRIRALQKGMGE